MQTVQVGDQIQVHYTGKLEDGTVFDSSLERDPLPFQVGSQQVIKGFDDGVIGMAIGDKKQITISPEEGYGMHDSNLIHEVDAKQIDPNNELKEGMTLTFRDNNNQQFPGTVKEVHEEKIVIDFNHFLAGKTLIFDIELMAIA